VTENDTIVFLLSIATLLGVARLLGELARAYGLPAVVGELMTGILLGKTVLGRVSPAAFDFLFPSGTPKTMLSAYTTIAVVLLLVVAGLEVDLGIVKRRGRTAMVVSLLGIFVPLAAGIGLGYVIPSSFILHPEQRVLFALFMGVALSISAMPVIAKTLLDLGLFKTDIGLLVMTAAMIDDLVGWLGFSILVGPMRGGTVEFAHLARAIAIAIVFVAGCLLVLRPLADRLLARLEENADVAPGRIVSLLVVAAVLGATAMQAIGIHAALGSFIVGVAVGDSQRLRERTRQTVQQFATNIFAPVFFASAGLRVDFIANFIPSICIAVFVVATLAKLFGCTVGARVTGLSWREASAVGFGLNARGAMEIILALLAREAGLIDDRIFVALVTMAIGTSLVAGPAMKRLLYARALGGQPSSSRTPVADDAAMLVRTGAFVPNLGATTSARAIEELGHALRPALGDLVETALISVLERELIAPTGLGDEVAIPHAAVEGLTRPVVALGLSREGIDFDAPDGRAARIVFLLLLPPKAYEREVRVLAALARSVFDDAARTALLTSDTMEAAVKCLDEHGRRIASSAPGPRMSSLTDM
jgi:Kef-type K+ transport system membrane component KefB/mannitol/fructose-specific phosphotransferase system IIA component (Ntr-type)